MPENSFSPERKGNLKGLLMPSRDLKVARQESPDIKEERQVFEKCFADREERLRGGKTDRKKFVQDGFLIEFNSETVGEWHATAKNNSSWDWNVTGYFETSLKRVSDEEKLVVVARRDYLTIDGLVKRSNQITSTYTRKGETFHDVDGNLVTDHSRRFGRVVKRRKRDKEEQTLVIAALSKLRLQETREKNIRSEKTFGHKRIKTKIQEVQWLVNIQIDNSFESGKLTEQISNQFLDCVLDLIDIGKENEKFALQEYMALSSHILGACGGGIGWDKLCDRVVSTTANFLPMLKRNLLSLNDDPDREATRTKRGKIMNFVARVAGVGMRDNLSLESVAVAEECLKIIEENLYDIDTENLADFLRGTNIHQIPPVLVLYRYGSIDQSSRAEKMLESYLNLGDQDRVSGFWLKVDSYFKYWQKSFGGEFKNMARNINAMIYLEKVMPGCVARLTEAFGIRNFGRYPENILIDQYRDMNQKDRRGRRRPYGAVFYPLADHNGAFFTDFALFENLYFQLANRVGIVIYESSGRLDLLHKINQMRLRFGQASFAIIGGHGTDSTIQFDETDSPNDFVRLDDIFSERFKYDEAKRAFVDNPTGILVSCSTGTKGGIGQGSSQKFGGRIIAPDKSTSIATFGKVEFDKTGAPIFNNVRFNDLRSRQEYTHGRLTRSGA